ncbi:MAG: hypothetical protein J0L84_18240 [Verrucomicrobia bacterium]|nr:hypothetical protein [Verrucomicrobiota bacterium]
MFLILCRAMVLASATALLLGIHYWLGPGAAVLFLAVIIAAVIAGGSDL